MRIFHYFLIIFSAACFTTAFAQAPAGQTTQSHSVLFTQLAQSATIHSMKKPNWYRLTLHHVANNIAWFTNRPARHHGTLPAQKFVQLWHKGPNNFSDTPPNADLVFLSKTSHGLTETHEHIVELTKPHYQPTHQQFSYQIKTLPPRHQMVLGKTRGVALFIDSADFDFGCIKVDFWKCF